MQPAPGSQPTDVPTAALLTTEQKTFTAGGVISRTFSIWSRHILLFSLMTLAADAPILLVALLKGVAVPGITAPNVNPLDPGAGQMPTSYPPAFWIAYLVTMLLFLVEAGAITHRVITWSAGRPASIGAMVSTGLRRLLPSFLAGMLAYLIITFGILLLIVPGVIFACALAPLVPVVVAERNGVFGAVGRSFSLTQGKRSSIFGVFLVLGLLFMGVTIFATFVLPALTRSFAPMLGTVLGLAVNVVFGTLIWVVPGVVYHDLRVAKEGVATEQLAAIFE